VAGFESVNSPWVICLARADAESLAPLRLLAGVDVAELGQMIWLRGRAADEPFAAKLAGLPASSRYELLPPNQLRQAGQRVPCGHLPEAKWQPLNRWLGVESPAPALPATVPAALALRLVRSAREHEPELLLTTLEIFKQYVLTAARVRLDCLQFAADEQGNLLVCGTPLPALPGQRYVLHQGVAVPAGFGWEPAVSAEVLVRAFGVAGDAIVLWQEDGSILRLHGEQFVPATRAAVLATGQSPDGPS
jgi:hypothetical protein